MSKQPIRIHYHRDFDGMVSAAILAEILREVHGERVSWSSINYDQRRDWDGFSLNERFAIVDFHFHPRADYWFDHHPTTFLSDELRAQYKQSERWNWDEKSPSCPPLILRHSGEHWDYTPPDRFLEMSKWSDVIDTASFESVDQAIFGEESAIRLTRCMTVAPTIEWSDTVVEDMTQFSLDEIAERPDIEKAHDRACRNRDKALRQFPQTVIDVEDQVLFYDASSNKVRRERFAPFYHHPEIHYAVGVIPTRAGFHVSAGENPWNLPSTRAHIGELMGKYGGGGHRSVGGANPPNRAETRRVAAELTETLRAHIRGL